MDHTPTLLAVCLVAVALAGCVSGGDGGAPSGPTGQATPNASGEPKEADRSDGPTDNRSGSKARIETEVINATLTGAGVFHRVDDSSSTTCAGSRCRVDGTVSLGPNATGLVAEMAWDARTPATQSFVLELSWATENGTSRQRVTGSSPLKMVLDDLAGVDRSRDLGAAGWPDQATTEDAALYAAANQTVSLHLSVFYNQPVDPQFSAVPQ